MTDVRVLRRADLPDGRVLLVRPVTPADVDALAALYAGLDVEDLHFRFFSVYHPPREFFDHWARVAERGGFGVVAEVTDGERHQVVGEAAYALLPDGDGEFGIAIAPDWRGWLGPFLLDVLVEQAAARGVPNLEADILLDNRRMLALVRCRGFAVLDHPDWTIVRVAIGAAQRTPGWPVVKDRPRLLVEAPGGRWKGEAAARQAGWDVIVCPGPPPDAHGRRGRGIVCPALDGRACPLAAGADAIVCSLPAAATSSAVVRAAHPCLHPAARIVDGSAPVDQILRSLEDLRAAPREPVAAGAVRP